MKREATLYDKFVVTAARVIGLLAPATARNYLKNHLQLRGYDAAVTFGSVNQEWRPGLFSGDKEIGKGYQVATERARDLDRNHPLVKEALKVSFAFSVGTALDPQFNILTDDKKRDDKAIDLIENAFWRWAEDCTIDGRDWQDIKELVFRHLKIDGEVFVIETADEHHPFKLQLVESTQLSSVEGNMKNGNFAVRGIEFNKFGRPVFYHFYKAQPGSFSLSGETVAVPARIVHHIYKPGRITETRGISHYVSAVMSLYDQNELSDQILELHRVAAAFGIIVESEDVDAVAGLANRRRLQPRRKSPASARCALIICALAKEPAPSNPNCPPALSLSSTVRICASAPKAFRKATKPSPATFRTPISLRLKLARTANELFSDLTLIS